MSDSRLVRLILSVVVLVASFVYGWRHRDKHHWIQSSPDFQLAKGVYATNLDGVHEGYRLGSSEMHEGESYTLIEVNASAPHLLSTFIALAKVLDHEGIQDYFYLEVPETKSEEEAHPVGQRNTSHSKVYYLDSPDYATLQDVVESNSDLLFNSGFAIFGIGSNVRKEEIGVEDYKTILIRSSHPEKFAAVLDQLHFKSNPHLKTVGQTITHKTPCYVRCYKSTHELQDLVSKLQKQGLYYYETRPE